MKLEKDLIKQISQQLDIYKMTGEVEWWARLNSGKVKTYYGSYIKLCDKDTPDFLALVRGRQAPLLAVFIEGKSDSGKLRVGQEAFKQKYAIKECFWYLELRDIKELHNWFNKHAKDFVALLPSEL